jgi:hypothetical protein
LLVVASLSSSAFAETTDELIALDKQWVKAGRPTGFVSEKVIGVSTESIVDYSKMLA